VPFRVFSANPGSVPTDREILQLARDYGWQPLGTSPDPIWKHLWEGYGRFPGDYECDEWGKNISAADAAALADALEQSATHRLRAFPKGPVLIREGMTVKQYRLANAELNAKFLAEFIEFLRHGEFSFFWDD